MEGFGTKYGDKKGLIVVKQQRVGYAVVGVLLGGILWGVYSIAMFTRRMNETGALVMAAQSGDLAESNALLDSGISSDWPSHQSKAPSPLRVALRREHYDIADVLIARGPIATETIQETVCRIPNHNDKALLRFASRHQVDVTKCK